MAKKQQEMQWIEIPNSNGQLLHVPSGRYMHVANLVMSGNRLATKLTKQEEKKEWIEIPNSNGTLLHVPTGQKMPKAQFAKFKESSASLKEAPDVLVRCHDVWRGGGFRKDIVLKHEHTWTMFLDVLESEFGEQVIFDYQDRGGKLITVNDVDKFERFCQAVDDASTMQLTNGRQYGTEIDVYIRPYNAKQQETTKGGMLEAEKNPKGQTPRPVKEINAGNKKGDADSQRSKCIVS
jgi:hypothetical protein